MEICYTSNSLAKDGVLSGGKGLKTDGGQELDVCLALVMVRCQGLAVHGNVDVVEFFCVERKIAKPKQKRF